MWDVQFEKASMLARVGDFYYNVLDESDKPIAHILSHVSEQCRIIKQADNMGEAIQSGGYFEDNFKMIRFKDSDIFHFATEQALQRQHRYGTAGEIKGASRTPGMSLQEYALIANYDDSKMAEKYSATLFPSSATDVTLASNTRLIWRLNIDPDIQVTTIRLDNGKLLCASIDFQTEFGSLIFDTHPVALFPNMRFMAQSYIRRSRNLYCYLLGVDVYGPVDRILYYYRVAQSVRSLYLASAQAAGMPVVRNECRILSLSPLHDGVSYITTDGRYDANFPHTHLLKGTILPADYVIGGAELYKLNGPKDEILGAISGLELDYALPVRGLIAPNKEITITDDDGHFMPMFEGSETALKAYHQFLKDKAAYKTDEMKHPKTANGMYYFMQTLCSNRTLVAQINRGQMTSDMELKLMTFLRRELPLGSVLTVAELPAIISENTPSDV